MALKLVLSSSDYFSWGSSQHVQYRTFWYVSIWEVCSLQLMNDILWEGKHIAVNIFKARDFVHTNF